jgi:hypothetical protein
LNNEYNQRYVNEDFSLKRQLIGSIFTGKLYFSKNKVRTTELNEAIKQIHKIDKAFRGKKKEQPQNFKQLSCWVARRDMKHSLSITSNFVLIIVNQYIIDFY